MSDVVDRAFEALVLAKQVLINARMARQTIAMTIAMSNFTPESCATLAQLESELERALVYDDMATRRLRQAIEQEDR